MPISALPKLCYELNGNGADAAGFGPTMTGASYTTGLLGQAFDATGSQNTVASAPGFNFSATASVGAWFYFSSGFLAVDDDSMQTLASSTSLNKTLSIFAAMASVGTVAVAVAGVTKNITPSAGWHHIGASLSGGSVEIFLDGVSQGAPASASIAGGSDEVTISGGYNTGIKIDQFLLADVAYSAADWLYIVNGGSGIAYASMSTGGGAGARFAGSLFLLGVGN